MSETARRRCRMKKRRRPLHPLVAELRAERLRQGVSLLQMEYRTGYTNQHIWQIENGTQGVDIAIVTELGDALGLKLKWENPDEICDSGEPEAAGEPALR